MMIRIHCLSIAGSILLLLTKQTVFAQQKQPEGFFTSEAKLVTDGEQTFVSIKKYNPTAKELQEAEKPSKTGQINFLTAPFGSVNISMYEQGFESRLYCLDKTGNSKWDYTIGYSNKSTASPVTIAGGFLYTGESVRESGKVVLQKLDTNGNLIWKTKIDSLQSVDDIFLEGDRVCALVSFDVEKKMEGNAGTFYFHSYPIYFFVQLDVATGKIIRKDYQRMANYLSGKNFACPQLNSDYSYFLSKPDSAMFLTVMKQDGATVVSQGLDSQKKIIRMTSGPESYHLLTASLQDGGNFYQLTSDFYGKSKKYQIDLGTIPANDNRIFLARTPDNSIVSVFAASRSVTVLITDTNSQTSTKKINTDPGVLIAGIAASNKQICLVCVEGRNKPGNIGRIKLLFIN